MTSPDSATRTEAARYYHVLLTNQVKWPRARRRKYLSFGLRNLALMVFCRCDGLDKFRWHGNFKRFIRSKEQSALQQLLISASWCGENGSNCSPCSTRKSRRLPVEARRQTDRYDGGSSSEVDRGRVADHSLQNYVGWSMGGWRGRNGKAPDYSSHPSSDSGSRCSPEPLKALP